MKKLISRTNPGLFGINYSNRDFTTKEAWGKNCFNSAFPTALCAYLHHKKLQSKYLQLNTKLQIEHSWLSIPDFFKISPSSDNIFYAFESQFSPYQQYIIGGLPGVDLVIHSRNPQLCLQAVEVKLTTIPDHTTCELTDNLYGCELVIRPDTIVYLACSLVHLYHSNSSRLFNNLHSVKIASIRDWSDPLYILPHLPEIVNALDLIFSESVTNQTPFLMQPIWKTEGKSPRLAEHCFDVFIWSNLAFTRLFIDLFKQEWSRSKDLQFIARHTRTIVWLFRMLYDFSRDGIFNHRMIFDRISYNTKNDKAFAVNGKITHRYMSSDELTQPRIKRHEVSKIILGGGQNLLSPERRLDAIIYNSPDLFTLI